MNDDNGSMGCFLAGYKLDKKSSKDSVQATLMENDLEIFKTNGMFLLSHIVPDKILLYKKYGLTLKKNGSDISLDLKINFSCVLKLVSRKLKLKNTSIRNSLVPMCQLL